MIGPLEDPVPGREQSASQPQGDRLAPTVNCATDGNGVRAEAAPGRHAGHDSTARMEIAVIGEGKGEGKGKKREKGSGVFALDRRQEQQ